MAAAAAAANAKERSQKADLWYDMVLEWAQRSDHPPGREQVNRETAGSEEPAELARQVENLKRALENSRKIGAAIGILMASTKLTEDAAFDLLVHVSRNTHRKLREVAEEVVLTGSLPAM
jgi:hypothetical protein